MLSERLQSCELRPPQRHVDTLGFKAVQYAEKHAVSLDEPSTPGFYTPSAESMAKMQLQAEAFREEIQELLDSDDQEALDGIFQHVSTFQRQRFEDEIGFFDTGKFAKWLIKFNSDDDEYANDYQARRMVRNRDDQRVINFLQFHNAEIESRQTSEEFSENVTLTKALWKEAAQRGISEGWLHTSVTGRIRRLEELPVYEGDFYSTNYVMSDGFHDIGRGVVLARKADIKSYLHEYNHAVLTFEKIPRNTANRTYLQNGLINEAITEHLALVMNGDRELEDISPGGIELPGTYLDERIMLADIISLANDLGTRVGITDFTLAYSANKKDKQRLVSKLNDKLNHAFGFETGLDFFGAIQSKFEEELEHLEQVMPFNHPYHLMQRAKQETRYWVQNLHLRQVVKLRANIKLT